MTKKRDSLPAVKPIKDFEPENELLFGEDLQGLFNNKEYLRLFVFLTRGYTQRFETAQAICIRLVERKRLCYLVDFDVIHNYLGMRSLDRVDTFPVDFIFLDSKASFAIPVGAFEELLRYLASLAKRSLKFQLKKNTGDFSAEEAVRSIAVALNIKGHDDLDVAEMIGEIGNRLDRNILILNRLLDLLTNPRFEGVKAQYDQGCYEAWLGAIQKEKRSLDPKPRSEVDRRDAMNLAVASWGLFCEEDSHSKVGEAENACRLLVSQTRAVLDLGSVKGLEEDEGIKEYFDMNALILRQVYPAVHPQDAMVVELLGGVEQPTSALSRIQSRTLTFRQLADHLQSQFVWAVTSAPKKLYVNAFGPFILQEREQIKEDLDKVSRDITVLQHELRLMEETRATIESERLGRSRQLGLDSTSEDKIRVKGVLFTKLLGEVAEALHATEGSEYTAILSEPNKEVPFKCIQIMPIRADSCDIVPLMTGELYTCQKEDVSSRSCDYFALHWSTTCLEEHLISGLRGAWAAGNGRHKRDESPSLVTVGTESVLWKQGLIIRTSVGDWGMSLRDAFDSGQWSWLKLRRISGILGKAIDEAAISDGTKELKPVVLQLRVNTLYGDIIYDVTVMPTNRRRYVTVLSHYDISRQISELYRNTGAFFCYAEGLSDVLHDVLQGFSITGVEIIM